MRRESHRGSKGSGGEPALGRYETDEELEARIEDELMTSKATLEAILNKQIIGLVWPGGGCSLLATKKARQAGYLLMSKGQGLNRFGGNSHQIRRFAGTLSTRGVSAGIRTDGLSPGPACPRYVRPDGRICPVSQTRLEVSEEMTFGLYHRLPVSLQNVAVTARNCRQLWRKFGYLYGHPSSPPAQPSGSPALRLRELIESARANCPYYADTLPQSLPVSEHTPAEEILCRLPIVDKEVFRREARSLPVAKGAESKQPTLQDQRIDRTPITGVISRKDLRDRYCAIWRWSSPSAYLQETLGPLPRRGHHDGLSGGYCTSRSHP